MACVGDGLIREVRVCTISSRSIEDIFTFREFKSNSSECNELVHLDQGKTWDKVDFLYLLSVLAQFGLGQGFLRSIIQL